MHEVHHFSILTYKSRHTLYKHQEKICSMSSHLGNGPVMNPKGQSELIQMELYKMYELEVHAIYDIFLNNMHDKLHQAFHYWKRYYTI